MEEVKGLSKIEKINILNLGAPITLPPPKKLKRVALFSENVILPIFHYLFLTLKKIDEFVTPY